MEKIKDALKKAKTNIAVNRKSTTLVRHVASNTSDDEELLLAKLVYNQENVVELNKQHLENNRIVAHVKTNPASWVFDALRTQILQKMEENNWKTVGIISPSSGSGKTLISINLAISIAQTPQKTSMVVDFDLRKPRVASYLGLNHRKSLNDFLKDDADLSEIIVNPSIPRFTVIPTNKSVNKSSETLSLSKIKNLIYDLKDRYESRIVIFDLPPILHADDAMVVIPHVDCVLIVVSDGADSEAELKQTMRLLDKTNILGCVVNRSEVEPKSYY
jgi:protein-tyrosine kinase